MASMQKYGDESDENQSDVDVEKMEKYPPTFFTDEKGNLKFVNLVVRYPWVLFSVILCISFLITMLLNSTVISKGNPFTDPANEFDLYDVRSIQYDSLRLAQEEVSEELAEAITELSQGNERPQYKQLDIVYWVYEGEKSSGVFGTKDAIKHLKESHDLFVSDSNYDNYCRKTYEENVINGECMKPVSPLNMYYASSWSNDTYVEAVNDIIVEMSDQSKLERFNRLSLCVTNGKQYCDSLEATDLDYEDWAMDIAENMKMIVDSWDGEGDLVDDIETATLFAAYLMLIPAYSGNVDFGYDKNFNVDNPNSMYSRAVFQWGGPLNQTTSDENEKKQSNVTEEEKEEEDTEALKVYIVDTFLDDMNKLSKSSASKNVNTYYFMGVLIGEELLKIVKTDGLLALASFGFVFLWIRLNVGSWFLAMIGILEIFLSLPIAWFFYANIFQIQYFGFLNALAIFIVAAIGADDIFIFMDAYKQSKWRDPQNLESLETRMTWVYRRAGGAMAITSATTCAAFLATMITPLPSIKTFGIFTALVILFDYILVMTLFCTAVVIYHNKFEDRSCFGSCIARCNTSDPTPTQKAYDSIMEDGGEVDRVSEFFKERVAGFVNVQLHRIVLCVLFLIWVAIALWQTSLLEPTKETEQFLDSNHPLQKSFDILGNEFPTSDEDKGLDIYFAWGLGEVNRKGVNLLFDDENYGKPTFLDDFTFDQDCQTAMLEVCEQLQTDERYTPYIKRDGGLGSVKCFVEELGAYNVLGSLDDCTAVKSGEWKEEDWQIAPNEIPSKIPSFLAANETCSASEKIWEFYSNEIGYNGEEMKYAAVSFESEVLDPWTQKPESFVREQYDFVISMAKEFNDIVSDRCAGDVIVTDLNEKFVFMNNQSIYIRTVLTSSLLGVAIAFVVLLLATRVLHIAAFATLSIACVLVSVAGMARIVGWYLGSIEAMLIGITAGFSVDYVVHLAHAYVTSKGNTEKRVIEAFGDLGISVFNGMATSVGASLPLFFCQLQFFKKFGIFICLTIAFSWIFANFAFMSLLAQVKILIRKGKSKFSL